MPDHRLTGKNFRLSLQKSSFPLGADEAGGDPAEFSDRLLKYDGAHAPCPLERHVMQLRRSLFPGHSSRSFSRSRPPHIRTGKPVAAPGKVVIVAHVSNASKQQVLLGYGVAKVGAEFGTREPDAGLDRHPMLDLGAQLLAIIDQFAPRHASHKP